MYGHHYNDIMLTLLLSTLQQYLKSFYAVEHNIVLYTHVIHKAPRATLPKGVIVRNWL